MAQKRRKRQLTETQQTALEHLHAALDTGVRDKYQAAIKDAIKVFETGAPSALTDNEYKNLPGPEIRDPEHKGLLMKIGRNDRRRWFFRTTRPGTARKQVEIYIGTYPDVSVSRARSIAADPRQQRSENKLPVLPSDAPADTNQPRTVRDLVAKYMAEWAEPRKRSWKNDLNRLKRHLMTNDPKHGLVDRSGWRIEELTTQELIKIIDNLSLGDPRNDRLPAPGEAEKVHTLIRTMFSVALGTVRRGRNERKLDPWINLPANPAIGAEPNHGAREITVYTPTAAEMSRYYRGVPPLKWSAWKVHVNLNSGGSENGKQTSEARGNRFEAAPG